MCCRSWIVCEGGDGNDKGDDINLIYQMYSDISKIYTGLIVNSNNSLKCDGNTWTISGWDVRIAVELQKCNGRRKTIKTCMDYDARYVAVSNDGFVESGYNYWLKITHYAYDNNLIKLIPKYSKTIIK